MNKETRKQPLRVLIVDDDLLQRKIITQQLHQLGFKAEEMASASEALQLLLTNEFDVVLLDVQMPNISGLEALAEIRSLNDAPEVVMLTGDKSLETGIAAMQAGAYHYLTKPAAPVELEAIIKKAAEKRRIARQNESLRELIQKQSANEELDPLLIHVSSVMQHVVRQAEAVAKLDSTILITGESGTGKEVLTRFIHNQSLRARAPLIAVNCGALPESLFETEFFGYERGAFTGANQMKRGLLEAADASTLFLDEVGEMPLAAQVKLLRFIESGSFRRVGATRDQRTDVRIIAATNRDLKQAIAEKSFRTDLFYRLNVINLRLPTLRERREDVPALINFFLEHFRARFSNSALELSSEARRRLEEYDYPGNVRELKNMLERAAALTRNNIIEAEQINLPENFVNFIDLNKEQEKFVDAISNPQDRTTMADAKNSIPTLAEVERHHIITTLNYANGNRERAAALLGISERTLYRRLREYDVPLI